MVRQLENATAGWWLFIYQRALTGREGLKIGRWTTKLRAQSLECRAGHVVVHRQGESETCTEVYNMSVQKGKAAVSS